MEPCVLSYYKRRLPSRHTTLLSQYFLHYNLFPQIFPQHFFNISSMLPVVLRVHHNIKSSWGSKKIIGGHFLLPIQLVEWCLLTAMYNLQLVHLTLNASEKENWRRLQECGLPPHLFYLATHSVHSVHWALSTLLSQYHAHLLKLFLCIGNTRFCFLPVVHFVLYGSGPIIGLEL